MMVISVINFTNSLSDCVQMGREERVEEFLVEIEFSVTGSDPYLTRRQRLVQISVS